MSDTNALAALGLEPAPEDPAEPAPTPEAPAAPEPEPVEEVVVPEGAENPDAVKNLIQNERKRAREAYARARELEQELKRREEAALPLETQIDNEKQRADAAEARAMRIEVAFGKGLPQSLATRLQGSTREELEADADALMSEFGARRPSGPGMDGGYQPTPPTPVSPEKAHNEFIGNLLAGTRHGQ